MAIFLRTLRVKHMKTRIISFIGGGNMAHSLIGGLLDNGVSAEKLRVADPVAEPFAAQFPVPIKCFTDNLAAIQDAEVIVLAVKPQVMCDVLQSLRAELPKIDQYCCGYSPVGYAALAGGSTDFHSARHAKYPGVGQVWGIGFVCWRACD